MPRPRPRPPRDRRGRFVNWSRTQTGTPAEWHLPTSEGEVVELVRRAREAGRRLRVVGSGHSWSGIAVPHDWAVPLDAMAYAPEVDTARGLVTVSGGMRLRDLSVVLAHQGFSLPVVGSIQAQSVAGALATGTHGSSLVHGNLSSLVTSVRIVTGTGDVLDLDGSEQELAAARVHLGALGVVTRVTLPIRPTRRLEQTIENVPVGSVPAILDDVARSAEYVKVWWLPHAPTAQVIRYTETAAGISRRPTAATQRWIDERVMHPVVFPALIAVQRRRPSITAGFNARLSTRYLGAAVQVGADMMMLNTPMPMRHRETEAAVPLTQAAKALEQVLELFVDGRPAATFPLEVRFVRGDESWLSPAYGADTCQIGAYTTDGVDCDPYFDAFWDVMSNHGARPHWGKELHLDASYLEKVYPRYADFVAMRDRWDPDRVFGGPFLSSVLGG